MAVLFQASNCCRRCRSARTIIVVIVVVVIIMASITLFFSRLQIPIRFLVPVPALVRS